jgi:hypothetical protein
VFTDCDLSRDFFGNPTRLSDFAITKGNLEWGGFGSEEMSDEALSSSDIDKAGRFTRINHCVCVNPVFTRAELNFDYNVKIRIVRERFVAMRRRC